MSFLKGVDYIVVHNPVALVHRALLSKSGFTVFAKTHFFLLIFYSHGIQKSCLFQTWIHVFELHLGLFHYFQIPYHSKHIHLFLQRCLFPKSMGMGRKLNDTLATPWLIIIVMLLVKLCLIPSDNNSEFFHLYLFALLKQSNFIIIQMIGKYFG